MATLLLASLLGAAAAAAADDPRAKVCFCPNWRYSNFNCSSACCSLPRPIECKPPPTPNPPTNMTTVTVEGAVAMGALTPRGEAPTIELNATGSKGWVIHMSGGGWGFRKNTSAAAGATWMRDGAAAGPPAGAEQLGAQPQRSGCYMFCDGILSADAAQNPLFHDYNKVFIPINDGTSFTGDLAEPIPASVPPKYPNKWPIYLRGGRIVTAVMNYLMSAHNMASATDVILTGGSSGGMAVYLVCDRIADHIRAANPKIRVSCLADAGMFLDHPAASGRPTLSPQFIDSFYACEPHECITGCGQDAQQVGVGHRELERDDEPGLHRALHAARHAVQVHLCAICPSVHQDAAVHRPGMPRPAAAELVPALIVPRPSPAPVGL
eukprot:COSAG04_NODE_589_length_12295_cov_12.315513_6_plen_380_part_00